MLDVTMKLAWDRAEPSEPEKEAADHVPRLSIVSPPMVEVSVAGIVKTSSSEEFRPGTFALVLIKPSGPTMARDRRTCVAREPIGAFVSFAHTVSPSVKEVAGVVQSP